MSEVTWSQFVESLSVDPIDGTERIPTKLGYVTPDTLQTYVEYVPPVENVYNVLEYGAVGDGTTNDDTAVAAAITALNSAGGGVLLFPYGHNFVLKPSHQISSNTTVVNQGTITLDPSYVNTTSILKGIFRIGDNTGTALVENVDIYGGLAVSDCFSDTTFPSPTFNVNDHKFVCYVHSVSTLINCKIHDFKTENFGSPVTLEKMGGIDGNPARNTHCYNIQYEHSWVGIQMYCNGWAYEDCSVHDVDVKYCYDDCVAIVGSKGGVALGTGIARRIQVYNIRGEKTGQTGAFVKLDATDGYLSDINVYGLNGYTQGVNEYIVGIIGASAANNKKFNVWGFQTSGTWNYGIYAQSNGRQLRFTDFYIEALHGLHFQGNATPQAAQSISITDGMVYSRNASSADTIEGNGISYSAGTSGQGFQNVYANNIQFRNKAVPINEGATVPSGTGVQGTYQNMYYDIDIRNSAVADCQFSSTNRTVIIGKEGASQTLYAQGNITGATTFTRVNGSTITATATGNVTTTVTNGVVAGDTLTLIITQDATGSRTISKPSNVKLVGGAFSPTATANAVDSWTLCWDGTNWREISRSLNMS